MSQVMRAKLIQIAPPPDDWYNLRRYSDFVFQLQDGTEERVSSLYVPADCRTVGMEVELVYTFFSVGDASGMHFEPRVPQTEQVDNEIPF